GVIYEIKEKRNIVIFKNNTPKGETGHVEGMSDLVEENYLISLEEEKGNGEIKGEVKGTFEEIEDRYVMDMISEIGTENGSNNTTLEEDTDNDRTSVEEKPHNPIEIIEYKIIIAHVKTKGVVVKKKETQTNTPNEPKRDKPNIPKTHKNNPPKEEKKLKPKPQKKQETPKK
ncbi:hypothetical protein ACEE78_12180, partial [Staphylococcus hyicus]